MSVAENQALLKDVISEPEMQGAEAIILGCTELPLCLTQADVSMSLVSPTEVLAKAIVREAYVSASLKAPEPQKIYRSLYVMRFFYVRVDSTIDNFLTRF